MENNSHPMPNSLVTANNYLVTIQPKVEFDESRIELLKRTVARGATDDEFALFVEQCKRTGLDPFMRQIYSIRRKQWNSQTSSYEEAQVIQISIDGFRLIADRTGVYAGQVGPWWCGPDGNWQEVWLNKEPPAAAKIGVLRHNFQQPLYRVALYKAYVQVNSRGEPVSRWKTDPAGMLAKCAEALALRSAFPNDLSGLYTQEEMGNDKEALEEAKYFIVDYAIDLGVDPEIAGDWVKNVLEQYRLLPFDPSDESMALMMQAIRETRQREIKAQQATEGEAHEGEPSLELEAQNLFDEVQNGSIADECS